MIDFQAVFHWARMNAKLSGSRIHGERHYLQVRDNGLMLAKETPGADETIVHLFGYLHDHMRINELKDKGHGQRAAKNIEKIRNNLLAELTDDQFSVLQYALTFHDDKIHTDNPTVAGCWDADRLDLKRVMIRVSPYFLNTEAAKRIIKHR